MNRSFRSFVIVVGFLFCFAAGFIVMWDWHSDGPSYVKVHGIECVTYKQGISCNWNGR